LLPVEALRAWLRPFVDRIATGQVMSPALASMVGGPSRLYAESGAQVRAVIALLVDRAVASGAIRLDIDRDRQELREFLEMTVRANMPI
jgi:hypothetical protein